MNDLKTERIYHAAVYVRLSKEDGEKEESDSIVNQRELIRAFLAGRPDIEICMEYADDADIIGLNQKTLIKEWRMSNIYMPFKRYILRRQADSAFAVMDLMAASVQHPVMMLLELEGMPAVHCPLVQGRGVFLL